MSVLRLIVAGLLLASVAANVAVAAPKSKAHHNRTATTCWKIKCTGSSTTCFIFAIGHGMEGGIPGVLSMEKIPCNSSGALLDPIHADAIFIPTNGNPSSGGMGWTAVDADIVQSSGDCNLTVYDDSPTYTSYTDWQAAH